MTRTVRTPRRPGALVAPVGFLTAEQAAKRWRVARRTVVAWCTRGVIAGAVKHPVARRPRGWKRDWGISNPTFAWVLPAATVRPVVKRGRPRGS